MPKQTIASLSEVASVAKKIIDYAGPIRVFVFYGDLGAGKTTLIKEVCALLGSKDPVSSPTFSIVNEYQCKNELVYHFDFYRIESEDEAFDLGYEEYFYSGRYCFIEWPERILNLLPEELIQVNLHIQSEDLRQISFKRLKN